MLLRHLEVFCTVYELNSMSRAAEKLNMTQPGVSRIISELEKEINTELFIRKNKHLIVTHQGKQCYLASMKVMHDVDSLFKIMDKNMPRKEIHVGCSTGISHNMMPAIVKRFKSRYPKCKVYIEEGTSVAIQEGLKEGKYGIGFVQELIFDKEIAHRVFCHDKVVAVKAPRYQTNTKKDTLVFKDLANEDLILTISRTGIRNIIERYANKKNISLSPIWSCTTGSTACMIAENGLGIALLSDKTVNESIKTGLLQEVEVEDLDLSREFYQIWKNSSVLSDEEISFLNIAFDEGNKEDTKSNTTSRSN